MHIKAEIQKRSGALPRYMGKPLQALSSLLIAPLAFGLCYAPLNAQDLGSALAPDSPVEKFSIYNFDQNTGWRIWKLEGSRAEIGLMGDVTMCDVRLRIFEPDEEQKVSLQIESPLATMSRGKETVKGPAEILVISDGFLLSGSDWTWQTSKKKLSINKKAHAVIDGTLGPILE